MARGRAATTAGAVPPLRPGAGADPGGHGARFGWGDAAFLAVVPLAVVVVLRVRPMAPLDMIDPSFYTAYATNGRRLMVRFGPDNYYWVRLGSILPSMAGAELFGPVRGFYAVRYAYALLATVPPYVLFLRRHGRPIAVAAALVVLTSPVVLSAWGTDYPDAAAAAYLSGGTALVFLDRPGGRRWWAIGAAVLALSVHAQAVAATFAGPALVVALGFRARSWRDAGSLVAWAVGAAAATTALVVAAARVWFLNADIWTPTLEAADSQDDQGLWHTAGFGWMLDVPYLLVPAVVVAAALAVTRRAEWRERTVEAALVAVAAAQLVAAAYLQLLGERPVLEFHLYSSMLWPGVLLALVVVLARLVTGAPADHGADGRVDVTSAHAGGRTTAERGRSRSRAGPLAVARAWAPALVVVGTGVVLGVAPDVGRLRWTWAGLALAAAAVLAVVAAERVPALRRRPTVRAAVVVPLVAALAVLTVAAHPKKASIVPLGTYHRVFGEDGGDDVDHYRASTRLAPFVESHLDPADQLRLWWPARDQAVLNQPAAQYLWVNQALEARLPTLTPADLVEIRGGAVTHLVLLSADGKPLPAAVEALATARLDPEVLGRRVIRSGTVRYSAWVVRIDPPPLP